MNTSYYISKIEDLLPKLGLSLENAEYNEIFEEQSDSQFLRKLKIYYNKLLVQYDDIEGGKYGIK